MLVLNNIEVIYSDVIQVLKGVSLEVPDGDIVALLGGNGAGKSTVLKAVSGLLETELGKVSNGSITWKDHRIENQNPEKTARLGIIQVKEGRAIFEHLTAEENLLVGANIRSDMAEIKEDMAMVYDYFPRLKQLRKRISGYLSGGEQQMLVVGRAMMARPKLMLLDEASLGLSPILVEEIFDIIGRFNRETKTSILVVEQNVRVALAIAVHGYIMENGRVVLDDSAEKLQHNEDVKEFYMGLGELGKRKSYREVKHYKRRKRWLG
ncbi:MAG: ABC transporter ATP-binding protein [Desulfobacteraceae bacterium]|jgi:branched-chain amino acid transport system ATP-binding protein|nr:MAG: ABC transporter ATP-binding protein [Desulfobacteraceae bacterium]